MDNKFPHMALLHIRFGAVQMRRFPLPYSSEDGFRITSYDRDIQYDSGDGMRTWYGMNTQFEAPDTKISLFDKQRTPLRLSIQEAKIAQVLSEIIGEAIAELLICEVDFSNGYDNPILTELDFSQAGRMDSSQNTENQQLFELEPFTLRDNRGDPLILNSTMLKETQPNNTIYDYLTYIELGVEDELWPES